MGPPEEGQTLPIAQGGELLVLVDENKLSVNYQTRMLQSK
jgi:hypothetical protein